MKAMISMVMALVMCLVLFFPGESRAQTGALLQTGQMTSFTTFGFDDGYYRTGRSFSYTDHGDGTVTDNVTGLMWAQDGDGPGCGNGAQVTWWDALAAAEALNFAEHTDWRLPNYRELESLVDYGRLNPAIDPIFTNTKPKEYWASTGWYGYSDPEYRNVFATIHFFSGEHDQDGLTNTWYYRLVRGEGALLQTGQADSWYNFDDGWYREGLDFDCTDHGDGTVTDNVTGLMWGKDALGPGWGEGTSLTWNEALVWAEDLDFAEHTDWRLPNVRELASLLHLWRAPRINPVFLNVTNGTTFMRTWTSTSFLQDPVQDAWYVSFTTSLWLASDYPKNAWCSVCAVRGGPGPAPTPGPPAAAPWIYDYDGDGTSDIAVFRPTNGLWIVRQVTRAYFGSSSDFPVPADYTGDETTDIAIFRESNGLWSVSGGQRTYFGGAGDLPVPGDYTGDGTADPGIYRESNRLWVVKGVTRAYFGSTGDSPVPGYWAGDGSKSIGVFRPANGLWIIRGITRSYFGSAGDTVIPGDYDGDGSWDLGVFRPANGLWSVKGVTRSYFGQSTDLPIPGGYQGDGQDCPGIFRSGLWIIKGLTRAYFGSAGDVPATR